jgi:UDP:flavonoid glycosyltransferase YjiC (YdhE family)
MDAATFSPSVYAESLRRLRETPTRSLTRIPGFRRPSTEYEQAAQEPSDARFQPAPPFELSPIAASDATPGSMAPPAPDEPLLVQPPPLRIVIMITGTLGDVMPFCQMARMLQDRYGHVVRIATHGDLRSAVTKQGVRFYPLGGLAQQMAGWGPSFSLVPRVLLGLAAKAHVSYFKLKVFREIIFSTYGACTEPDPDDPAAEPFRADAIIANPMSVGHVHCAEALGIPLHLMFPNPWVATTDYPHSFSGWQYEPNPSRSQRYANFASYKIVDDVLWHSFLTSVNELRTNCRLRTIRLGAFGGGLVADNQIPFSQMWSPSLCPRPADWPAEASVVGFFFWDQEASQVDETAPEIAALLRWLAAGPKPVYVGFGSMPFPGPATVDMIAQASERAGVRVLLQSGGGDLSTSSGSTLPPSLFHIGRCPHDWLLPRVAALVHHGGAGTVGAGLRLGIPTMCCPFFGDQFFYGAMVARSGAGPPPIPFASLTPAKLAAAFTALLSTPHLDGAARIASVLRTSRPRAGLTAAYIVLRSTYYGSV